MTFLKILLVSVVIGLIGGLLRMYFDPWSVEEEQKKQEEKKKKKKREEVFEYERDFYGDALQLKRRKPKKKSWWLSNHDWKGPVGTPPI